MSPVATLPPAGATNKHLYWRRRDAIKTWIFPSLASQWTLHMLPAVNINTSFAITPSVLFNVITQYAFLLRPKYIIIYHSGIKTAVTSKSLISHFFSGAFQPNSRLFIYLVLHIPQIKSIVPMYYFKHWLHDVHFWVALEDAGILIKNLRVFIQ